MQVRLNARASLNSEIGLNCGMGIGAEPHSQVRKLLQIMRLRSVQQIAGQIMGFQLTLVHAHNNSRPEFEPERRRTDSTVAGRAWNTAAGGAAKPDRSGCGSGSDRQCDRQATGTESQDGDVVASPLH